MTPDIDILQGEDHCHYGTLLPTLGTIIKKTKAIKPDLSIMTKGLADVNYGMCHHNMI